MLSTLNFRLNVDLIKSCVLSPKIKGSDPTHQSKPITQGLYSIFQKDFDNNQISTTDFLYTILGQLAC